MFGVGTQELLVILFTVLILFGSKRIPEVARSIGSGLATFRRVVRDAQREIDAEILNPPVRGGTPKPAAGNAGAQSPSQELPQSQENKNDCGGSAR